MAATTIENGVYIRKLTPLFKEDTMTWETRADTLARGGPYVCWYCKAVARGASMEAVRAPSTPCKKCARCHEAQYCSTDCQRAHWKKGHKRTCGLKDPCPICLERSAPDGPNNFMCFVCGFRCCGDCSDLKRFRLNDSQPLCYFSLDGDKPVCPGGGPSSRAVPRCFGAFTPSRRLVSRNDGGGWFLFRFWAVSDGPGSESTGETSSTAL